jgi:hypothetical protein
MLTRASWPGGHEPPQSFPERSSATSAGAAACARARLSQSRACDSLCSDWRREAPPFRLVRTGPDQVRARGSGLTAASTIAKAPRAQRRQSAARTARRAGRAASTRASICPPASCRGFPEMSISVTEAPAAPCAAIGPSNAAAAAPDRPSPLLKRVWCVSGDAACCEQTRLPSPSPPTRNKPHAAALKSMPRPGRPGRARRRACPAGTHRRSSMRSAERHSAAPNGVAPRARTSAAHARSPPRTSALRRTPRGQSGSPAKLAVSPPLLTVPPSLHPTVTFFGVEGPAPPGRAALERAGPFIKPHHNKPRDPPRVV